jgi:hypothetical protein
MRRLSGLRVTALESGIHSWRPKLSAWESVQFGLPFLATCGVRCLRVTVEDPTLPVLMARRFRSGPELTGLRVVADQAVLLGQFRDPGGCLFTLAVHQRKIQERTGRFLH